MTPQEMEQIIASAGRVPRQRTTLYADAESSLRRRSFDAADERKLSVAAQSTDVQATVG
jgi:FO synthase